MLRGDIAKAFCQYKAIHIQLVTSVIQSGSRHERSREEAHLGTELGVVAARAEDLVRMLSQVLRVETLVALMNQTGRGEARMPCRRRT